MSRFSCSRQSIDAGETMFGTAPRVDVWLLLECREAWARKPLPSSRMPDAVKKRLGEWLDAVPNSRLQLIKRRSNSGDELKFYAALSRESQPKLYEFTLSSYDDLLGFDIERVLSDGETPPAEERLFLVCAHGTHDACCGTYGAPVYLEAEKGDDSVWQSTHLGGHRFAPTLVCLPEGIYYGRVGSDGIRALINRHKSGLITTENYRGRSCFSHEAQAAEFFLMRETGLRGVSEFRLMKSERPGDFVWRLQFASSGGARYEISVSKNPSAIELITSCGDDEKSAAAQFELLSIIHDTGCTMQDS